ncbi:MAG: membrane protein insertase YidC [Prevotellaceae bacterium]|jgi:YidC/Oxa1 family membrane protein insertase|nr:membrane protein insertase YidC [Prevotellaceae bacterium]
MDKNTILGLVIIAAILIGFGIYNSNQVEEYNRQKKVQDSIAYVEYQKRLEEEQKNALVAIADSTIQQNSTEYAPLYQSSYLNEAAEASQEFYTIENDLLKLTISSKGGRVYSAELKEYTKYGGSPLLLLDDDNNKFAIDFYANQMLSTSDFSFAPLANTKNVVVNENDTLKYLSLRLHIDSLSYIEYTYGMRPNDYMVDLDVKLVGLDKYIPRNATSVDLRWEQNAPALEKGFRNESTNTTLAYRFPNSSVEELSATSENDTQSVKNKVQWVAFKQQFFSTILTSKEPYFLNAELASIAFPENNADSLIKHFSATMQLPYNPNQSIQHYPLSIFYGPNGYRLLRSYDQDFQELVPLGGWAFGWINRWVIIPIFDFLSRFISNYGLIILLLTIIIKILLFPLTRKSYISTAKMKLLKPEIEKIAAKYPKKEDAMKKQQETMGLYRKYGVNMMGGCLPMLLQLPILFAMFRFFPASIELRQQSFLWADDLSSYDSILDLPFNIPMYGSHISLFTILMAVTMFITSKHGMQQQASTQQAPGMKFMMLYFMPIFMLFIFNNLSSALVYYYFLANLITILQNWVTRKWIVTDKTLLAQMHAKAKEAPKKSKFQQRLEDLQKKQAEMQRQQPKKKR